jgi:hypothetical protein
MKETSREAVVIRLYTLPNLMFSIKAPQQPLKLYTLLLLLLLLLSLLLLTLSCNTSI